MLLVPLQMCLAGNVKKISVTFNKNDFTLSMNSNGLLDIISNKQVASYGEDVSEPGLPLIPVNVLIPDGSTFAGLNVSASKSLIRENVTIAANPRMMPTNSTSISSLNSGIYIVSLFVKGKLVDYQRLIKE